MRILVIGLSNSHKSSDWIAEKVKPLIDSKEACAVSNVHYQGHHWSIVKLILLGGWVYVYTTIIPKWYRNYRYVDLLAGSGTTYVKETKDVVIGSPFVARDFARNPFKSYVFIEKDSERCEALDQRVSTCFAENQCKVFKGDCNKYVRSVFAEENIHSLVFIDNEGFDVTWNTIEVVLKAKTDILINFPTSMVSRTADDRTASTLNQFYGDHSWINAENREEFLQIYLQKLKDRFKELRGSEAYVSNIRVGTGSYFYDIILVCKMGPFVNAWNYLKKKLDWQDPKTIQITLDILMKRATRMDEFIYDLRKEMTSIEHKPKKRKKDQTLEGFIFENQTSK
jgi:three-Cys-motif partner protein